MHQIEHIRLFPAELRDFESISQKEWLVTNGRGGYASGTVSGANTRRYHGLLVASLLPPVNRVVMISKIDEEITCLGRTFPLSANEFADSTISPTGFHFLTRFCIDGQMPVWTFSFGDLLIEKRIWMRHGAGNTSYVQYTVLRGQAPVTLVLRPLCIYREPHYQNRGGHDYQCVPDEQGIQIQAFPAAAPYSVRTTAGKFVFEPSWYWNFKHRVESERGLDDVEDLFVPGVFHVELGEGQSVTIICSTISSTVKRPLIQGALKKERARIKGILSTVPKNAPAWISQLFIAADQFIVDRVFEHRQSGKSIIAGYHWFSDWTRDTMLALSGLTLVTGRKKIAREILSTYQHFVSEGMLPNRFPDSGADLEYNSVDGTLLYFYAVKHYLDFTHDFSLAEELYPVLAEVVSSFRQGTRFNIHVDATDRLLFTGEPGVQMTWMDAKVGDWVVTPRVGKPVEVNALWYQALALMTELSAKLGKRKFAANYLQEAEAVKKSFQKRFWYAEGGYLYDVIDEPVEDKLESDSALRPNQLFAAGLDTDLLSLKQVRQIVDRCSASLCTPYGLRSLEPRHPRYRSTYQGDQAKRDASYHQGTVWPWLAGFFISAHLKAYRDKQRALSYLESFSGHLLDAGLGTISEIFDAEPPHIPRGCIAQAWSVGEILRAWYQCERFKTA